MSARRARVAGIALWVLPLLLAVVVDGVSAQGRRELRVGVAGVPAALDPASALDGPTPLIARHVFETLVAHRDLSTDVEPALATRWTVSRDGLVWTFAIRDGARFHDGSPLTALEIAASFERHLKPDDGQTPAGAVWGPLLRGSPGVVKEIRAPDPRTLQIVLVQPYAPLLTVLAHPGFGVVRRTSQDGAPRLVGSGAYRVVDVSPGRIALEAAAPAPGASRAERIVFLDVASEDQAEAELTARTLDVWLTSAAPRRADGVLSTPGLRIGYLAFQTEREPLSRRAIRRAFAQALDPPVLASALEPHAIPLQSFVPPGVWARREGSPILGGGRDAVKKLLVEGGWPRGYKPTLLVAAQPTGLALPKVAETIQRLLGAADIPIHVRVESPDAARAALQAGEYDLALTEATATAGDPHFLLFPLSTSESATKGPRALNFSYYRNARLDDVLIRASQLSFRVERQRLYQRAQAMLAEELPWVPVYVKLQWALVRPDVRGLRLHPSGFHRLGGVTLAD